jgi:epoxyqueuosine reductase
MNANQARNPFVFPFEAKRLLLHCCCAPCAGGILTRLLDSGITVTVFFYNPNIYPQAEYEKRKGEIVRFAQKNQIKFIDADYDPATWQERVKGLESEPERGKRCAKCFDLRLERTAIFAHENNFSVFATTLGISRWKDLNQVNAAGLRAAGRYPGLTFWPPDWRKDGGSKLGEEITKTENFYRQKYCGCRYSLSNQQTTVNQ